jgi:hypothetical protein
MIMINHRRGQQLSNSKTTWYTIHNTTQHTRKQKRSQSEEITNKTETPLKFPLSLQKNFTTVTYGTTKR